MRRLLAVLRKEFRQIRRDPLSLGILVLIPALLLILYGYALSFDIRHIRLAVLDNDRSPESRRFLDSVFQNPYFASAGTLRSSAEADGVLLKGEARAALIIPRGYAGTLMRGETARVQTLVDGADANTASTTTGYLEALAGRETRRLRRNVPGPAGAPGGDPGVVLEPRIWFNPDLVSARFLIPGLVGMLLMLSAVIATSLSIVREKERGTMDQLRVSPLGPTELLLGKTLPYLLICLVTMAAILGAGGILFGVAVRGSYVVLGGVTMIFLFAALGMGLFISSITNSQQVAFQIAVITSLLPSVILSGLIFPVANMPVPIRLATALVIPRYFIAALRKIILKGAPISALGWEITGLLALGILFHGLAAWQSRKEA
ncbi:MAG: ABC transporter permease [Planctomycetota bacterium]